MARLGSGAVDSQRWHPPPLFFENDMILKGLEGGGSVKRYDSVGLRSWGNASRDQVRESGRSLAGQHGDDRASIAYLNEDVKCFLIEWSKMRVERLLGAIERIL